MINPFPRSKVITVQNGDSGKITAFFSDLPGLVVQGNSKSDVVQKLVKLVEAFAEGLKKSSNNLDIQTMSLV